MLTQVNRGLMPGVPSLAAFVAETTGPPQSDDAAVPVGGVAPSQPAARTKKPIVAPNRTVTSTNPGGAIRANSPLPARRRGCDSDTNHRAMASLAMTLDRERGAFGGVDGGRQH